MNHTTKTTTRLGIATAITTVTLALLVTAGTVVIMIPVQSAQASCISGPKGSACSSIQGTASCSAPGGCLIIPGSGTSSSVSIDSKGTHFSESCGKGSTSENQGHPIASSGKGCP
jgi:hypothetical protein